MKQVQNFEKNLKVSKLSEIWNTKGISQVKEIILIVIWRKQFRIKLLHNQE